MRYKDKPNERGKSQIGVNIGFEQPRLRVLLTLAQSIGLTVLITRENEMLFL
mgnify:CR=1 FL=1